MIYSFVLSQTLLLHSNYAKELRKKERKKERSKAQCLSQRYTAKAVKYLPEHCVDARAEQKASRSVQRAPGARSFRRKEGEKEEVDQRNNHAQIIANAKAYSTTPSIGIPSQVRLACAIQTRLDFLPIHIHKAVELEVRLHLDVLLALLDFLLLFFSFLRRSTTSATGNDLLSALLSRLLGRRLKLAIVITIAMTIHVSGGALARRGSRFLGRGLGRISLADGKALGRAPAIRLVELALLCAQRADAVAYAADVCAWGVCVSVETWGSRGKRSMDVPGKASSRRGYSSGLTYRPWMRVRSCGVG